MDTSARAAQMGSLRGPELQSSLASQRVSGLGSAERGPSERLQRAFLGWHGPCDPDAHAGSVLRAQERPPRDPGFLAAALRDDRPDPRALRPAVRAPVVAGTAHVPARPPADAR